MMSQGSCGLSAPRELSEDLALRAPNLPLLPGQVAHRILGMEEHGFHGTVCLSSRVDPQDPQRKRACHLDPAAGKSYLSSLS